MSFDPSPVHDRALRHSVTDYVLDAVRAGRLAPAETADRVARHERVLALLESGDPDAAAQELEGHVREAGEGNLRRRFTRIETTAPAQTP